MYLFQIAKCIWPKAQWLYRFIMKAGAGRRTERLLACKLAGCPSALARLYTGHWTTFKTVFTKLLFLRFTKLFYLQHFPGGVFQKKRKLRKPARKPQSYASSKPTNMVIDLS